MFMHHSGKKLITFKPDLLPVGGAHRHVNHTACEREKIILSLTTLKTAQQGQATEQHRQRPAPELWVTSLRLLLCSPPLQKLLEPSDLQA